MDEPDDLTSLLQLAGRGDVEARSRLMAVMYDELRALAARQVAGWLDPDGPAATTLVHECYLRLIDRSRLGGDDRRQFFAIAAATMRDILVDEARRHGAAKRGGGRRRLPLDAIEPGVSDGTDDLGGLAQAIEQLAAEDPRSAEIVMLRFFGGLTHAQIAELLALPVIRVRREWDYAKAWLQRKLG